MGVGVISTGKGSIDGFGDNAFKREEEESNGRGQKGERYKGNGT